MTFAEFKSAAGKKRRQYDVSIGRKYNHDSFFPAVRSLSLYLTYFFFKINWPAPYLLVLHFWLDAMMLLFIAIGELNVAFACFVLAHIIDNCDGDLARMQGNAHEWYGKVDILFHTIANAGFWLILHFIVSAPGTAVILAALLILHWHRFQMQLTGVQRWGEWLKAWSLAAWPMNVNAMYFLYFIFAAFGVSDWYILGYIGYTGIIAVGQTGHFLLKGYQ